MSVNWCSVRELKAILNEYPDDMNVVVLRHPNYRVHKDGDEYDGIRFRKIINCIDTLDVYRINNSDLFEPVKVLLLSSTPIKNDKKEQT